MKNKQEFDWDEYSTVKLNLSKNKSKSLKSLRKTSWVRKKVESLNIATQKCYQGLNQHPSDFITGLQRIVREFFRALKSADNSQSTRSLLSICYIINIYSERLAYDKG